VGMKDLRLS